METDPQIALKSLLIPLSLVLFLIATGVVLLYQQYQKRLYLQQLDREALKTAHQQELLKHAIQVEERERKTIAANLHDELGAALSILRMHLLLTKESEFAGRGQVVELTEKAIATTRSISHQLLPPQLQAFGLAKTLESVTDSINSAGAVRVELAASELSPLPWPVSLGLYRIVMELLQNALKHSGATTLQVRLTSHASVLECSFTDNGRGLPDPLPPGSGLGLKSIEARVQALEGQLTCGNRPGGGFSASIRIPLTEKQTP